MIKELEAIRRDWEELTHRMTWWNIPPVFPGRYVFRSSPPEVTGGHPGIITLVGKEPNGAIYRLTSEGCKQTRDKWPEGFWLGPLP